MSDYMDIMLSLYDEGYDCAQILMRLVLDAEEKENPDLIRTLAGLNGGIGGSGHTCGCMTGGACLLAYYAAKGASEETTHEKYREMSHKFVEWFEAYTAEYGGTECSQILDYDSRKRMQRRPTLTEPTSQQCIELLDENELL